MSLRESIMKSTAFSVKFIMEYGSRKELS